jgi:hypothetical protein
LHFGLNADEGKLAMGLAFVEFVMEIEESFNVSISDADAQRLTTPGRVIDYLHDRLPRSLNDNCISQRAFYKLRRVITEKRNIPKSWIHPRTRARDIFPDEELEKTWNSMFGDVGVPSNRWPQLSRSWWTAPPPPLIRDAVRVMVACHSESSWTRRQIAEVVHAHIREQFGISKSDYTENSRFAVEMGID